MIRKRLYCSLQILVAVWIVQGATAIPKGLNVQAAEIAQTEAAERLIQERKGLKKDAIATQHQSLKELQQSLDQSKASGNQQETAAALQNLGAAYHDIGAPHLSLNQYQKALTLYKKLGDRLQEAVTLRSMGEVHVTKVGQLSHAISFRLYLPAYISTLADQRRQAEQKAQTYYEQSLELFQQLKEDRQSAQTLNLRALLYDIENTSTDYTEIRNILRQALKLARTSGDDQQAAIALRHLGQLEGSWKRKKQTWQAFEQSLEISRTQKDQTAEAQTLYVMAQVYNVHFGNPDQALTTYRQSLELAETSGNLEQSIQSSQAIAELLFRQGQSKQALALYQQALTLAQQLGHWPTQVQTLTQRERLLSLLRQPQQSLKGLKQVLETVQQASQFYEQVGDSQTASTFQLLRINTLVKVGKQNYNLNQKQQAFQAFTQAQQYFQGTGDAEGEATLLTEISNIFYHSFLDYPQTLSFLQKARQVYQRTGDRKSEANLLADSIASYWRYNVKDLEQALATYRQAVQIYRELQNFEQAAYYLGYPMVTILEELKADEQLEALYQEALQAYQQAGNRQKESDFLQKLGEHYYQAGNPDRALETFQQAHQVFLKGTSDGHQQQAKALTRIAETYADDLKNKPKAVEFYRQAVPLFAAINAPIEQAQTLIKVGTLYLDLKQPQAARIAYQQARTIYQKHGDRNKSEAWALSQIGRAYANRGNFQTALTFYKQALASYQARKDPRLITLTLLKIGQVHAYAGNQKEGLEFCDRALREIKKYNTGFRSGTFAKIGKLCHPLGGQAQATEAFKGYLGIYQKTGDPYQEASALLRIGKYYSEIGALDQVLIAIHQARDVYRKIGDRLEEAKTLRRSGFQYWRLGNLQKAVEFFNQSLTLAQQLGNRRLQAQNANDSGKLYRQLDDYPKALSFFRRSRRYYQQLGDRNQAFSTLSEIAETHHQAGDFPIALRTFQAALREGQELGGRQDTNISHLLSMGDIYTEQGQPQTALNVLKQAQSLAQQYKNPQLQQSFRALGQTYLTLNQPKLALQNFEQSLPKDDRNPNATAAALLGMAKATRALGEFSTSLTHIKAAISLIEEQRVRKKDPTERQDYFAEQQNYYEFYIDLLMNLHKQDSSQGYDAQALYASEQSRARSLLDLLSEANTDIRKGVDPSLVAQERRLQQQLDTIEQRRVKLYSNPDTTLAEKAALEQERQYLLSQYQTVQTKIRKQSPSYAALTQPQPLTLQQIQSQILDDDTLLLQYALGEKQSYLWAITKTGFRSYPLPTRAAIEAATKRVYRRLRDPSKINTRGTISVVSAASGSSGSSLSQLSQLLLGPLANTLQQQRLLIVSDGALHYLPFSSLFTPESVGSERPVPLVTNHEVVHLPSTSSLAILRQEAQNRTPAPKAVAIMADPVFSVEDRRSSITGLSLQTAVNKQPSPANTGNQNWEQYLLSRSAQTSDVGVWQRLPGTRREAEAILALVPEAERTHAFDFEANRTAASDPQLSQYRMVHFATHGLLNSANPELSGIVLSMVNRQGQAVNGFLRLHDVFNLELSADLVVLSACQTGLGQSVQGEGLVGLTRGFMYAGTPRVLVSLWNVDDEATAELMARFYRAMLEDNLSATAALRAAQLQMQTETRWKAPYYWAAFTLQGDWL